MPSYATPSSAPAQTTAEPYSRTCAVPADPLAQQAASYGNAFMLDQMVGAPGRSGERWARDPSLSPFYELLNDDTLAPATRAEAMLSYRNQKLAKADWSALAAILAGDDEMPLSLAAGQEGTHFPLFERLGADPVMQQLVLDLSERALAMPTDEVDIHALWAGAQASAAALAGPEGADRSSLMALQAMATFMNAQKFDNPRKIPLDPATGLPMTLPEGISPELWAALSAANQHVQLSPSPRAAVMSHGVPARRVAEDVPFTRDNNFHFWTHAWVSAALQAEQGLSPEAAEDLSALAGAQYELKPGSFREQHGNAGIKDILVNAEGAAFGSDLVRDPGAALPGQDQGPAYDVRALSRMKTVDPDTAAVLERADLSTLDGLLEALLDGVLRNDALDGSTPAAGGRLPHPLR